MSKIMAGERTKHAGRDESGHRRRWNRPTDLLHLAYC